MKHIRCFPIVASRPERPRHRVRIQHWFLFARVLGVRQFRIGIAAAIALWAGLGVDGSDWPQWRGANRDGRAIDFKAPEVWPKELKQGWKATVGDGVATPALAGGKLYVFSREGGQEALRCLDASDGKQIWKDQYDSLGATGPAQSFSGPRCSPAVGDGKVVTVGVRGVISCLEADTGKVVWRKDDFKSWPNFFPSSSPLILNGVCIAQLGGRENGAIVAYDLATGEERWKWSGGAPAYASPAVLSAGGKALVIAHVESKLVGVDASNGKLAWEFASEPGGGGGRGQGGGGRDYRAATPVVEGQTVFVAGRGIRAFRLQPGEEGWSAEELWSATDKSVQFNTPVVRDGYLYAISPGNEIYCLNAKDGKTLWTAPFPGNNSGGANEGEGRGGGGGRGRRGGGSQGYGSLVAAGSVLLALTPSSQLVVFGPEPEKFHAVASYKVSETPTHAHPIASGNRLFIKDRETLTLWTID